MLVLAGLSGASPLATDMYVPALPDLARSLATDASGAQMSLTGFLAGIIVGQLVLGPLSDAVGRRPVLIGGSVLFTVFSAVCALAPTVEVLNTARVGQGIAGAAECRECRVTVWRTADRMLIAFRRPATDQKGECRGLYWASTPFQRRYWAIHVVIEGREARGYKRNQRD